MPSSAPTRLLKGFPPVSAKDARVLILGSMPGTASLQAHQYYAHPHNRFWPIMGELVGATPALPYAQRLLRLKQSGIALWDVFDRCERDGGLDSAIRDDTAQANDFPAFFAGHRGVRTVLFNGAKAESGFRRLAGVQPDALGVQCVRLPSTSPANASIAPTVKLAAWRHALAQAGVSVS
ncbi:DNA-deoxyinosine glycosylase [Lysobacter sp. S4-A87]|uniref:DNA-deoxyinosine glycosylase n=1 Tax=Lysobacter sp. S4-A87 TaxID=2925843 RepID=UPI001F537DD1|nr:DNA-deoxyinosine glycosylase [Lysobacter sp. S4-A87]UNK50200.1 DNA-deoxyinosine glycosylase [Lysobacter sp. S4-A87]